MKLVVNEVNRSSLEEHEYLVGNLKCFFFSFKFHYGYLIIAIRILVVS